MTIEYNNSEDPPSSKLLTIIIWLAVISVCVLFYALAGKGVVQETHSEYRQFMDTSFHQSDYEPFPRYQVLASVTMYSKKETCPHRDCITASGVEAGRHIVACPYNIPLGTIVEILDEKYVCGDRTSIWIQEKRTTFDLWADNYESAILWGVRRLPVLVY